MDYPKRKSIRLKGYNYSSNGAYFITICSNNRKYLFGNMDIGSLYDNEIQILPVIPPYMYEYPQERLPYVKLNKCGFILNDIIKSLGQKFTYIAIETYVIMPNHFHLVISINNKCDIGERAIHESPLPQEKRSIISNVTGYLKAVVSKKIHLIEPDIIDIWQRSFHDRIIRNEKEYIKIRDYIRDNPLRWREDCFYNG